MTDTSARIELPDLSLEPQLSPEQTQVEVEQQLVSAATAAANLQEGERRTFSLRNKLRGIRQRTAKFLIYTDQEPLEEFVKIARDVERYELGVAGYEESGQADSEPAQALKAKLQDATNDRDALREQLLAGALAIKIKAIDSTRLQMIERAVRKAYKKGDRIPEEQVDDANNFRQALLYKEVVTEIRDADGGLADLTDDEAFKSLAEDLPPTENQKMIAEVNRLLFIDQTASIGSDDPGF